MILRLLIDMVPVCYEPTALLVLKLCHGTTPSYLQSCFTRVADMTPRRRLRSSASRRLEVPPVRLSAVGKRAFPVTGANTWNDLPFHITSVQSLAVFTQLYSPFEKAAQLYAKK